MMNACFFLFNIEVVRQSHREELAAAAASSAVAAAASALNRCLTTLKTTELWLKNSAVAVQKG
jgi:hypothetical protein